MNKPLHVAVLHYHLHRGGVTRIIQQACKSLHDRVSFHAITGINDSEHMPNLSCELQELEGLGAYGYARESPWNPGHDDWRPRQGCSGLADNQGNPILQASELLKQVQSKMPPKILELEYPTEPFPNPYDVWHVHNHALGKNPVLTELVYLLARRKHPLLLQLHDFAEDGRPQNYRFLTRYMKQGDPKRLRMMLYPQSPRVHYAVLNARDQYFLMMAGVPKERLHFLPNPIGLEETGERQKLEGLAYDRLFIYPTRAIRRKNLGEYLLWASTAEPGDLFAVTLAPHNPVAKPIYDRWVSFAQRLRLPVEFEIGNRLDVPFGTLIRSADALVTTSIAEGFGLAFLEPWLFERPVIGRNLPDITQDFIQDGMDLSHLYDELLVPLDWVGAGLLRKKVSQAAEQYLHDYDRQVNTDFIERAVASMVKEDRVEFGRLDEELQEKVIEIVASSPSSRTEMSPSQLTLVGSDPVIQQNRSVIQSRYNLEQYGNRLMAIYEKVYASEAGPLEPFRHDRLLDCFLSPTRMNLLRTA